MRLSNRFGIDSNQFLPTCERKQKCPNQFQTDLAQTCSKVGLESGWNRFEGYKTSCERSSDLKSIWV